MGNKIQYIKPQMSNCWLFFFFFYFEPIFAKLRPHRPQNHLFLVLLIPQLWRYAIVFSTLY